LGGLRVGGLCYRVARDDVLIQEREGGGGEGGVGGCAQLGGKHFPFTLSLGDKAREHERSGLFDSLGRTAACSTTRGVDSNLTP